MYYTLHPEIGGMLPRDITAHRAATLGVRDVSPRYEHEQLLDDIKNKKGRSGKTALYLSIMLAGCWTIIVWVIGKTMLDSPDSVDIIGFLCLSLTATLVIGIAHSAAHYREMTRALKELYVELQRLEPNDPVEVEACKQDLTTLVTQITVNWQWQIVSDLTHKTMKSIFSDHLEQLAKKARGEELFGHLADAKRIKDRMWDLCKIGRKFGLCHGTISPYMEHANQSMVLDTGVLREMSLVS